MRSHWLSLVTPSMLGEKEQVPGANISIHAEWCNQAFLTKPERLHEARYFAMFGNTNMNNAYE